MIQVVLLDFPARTRAMWKMKQMVEHVTEVTILVRAIVTLLILIETVVVSTTTVAGNARAPPRSLVTESSLPNAAVHVEAIGTIPYRGLMAPVQ